MRKGIIGRIERHLDDQLGVGTRLAPWRREIVSHLEEAHQATLDRLPEATSDTAWQSALTDFGDVQEVASQLRKEHWPQHLVLRSVLLVAAAAIVFSMIRPMALLDLPALSFTLGPLALMIAFDACRGSARWELARRVGMWGGIGGAVLGMVSIVSVINLPGSFFGPYHVGACMAISLLSALYCVWLFPATRSILAMLVGVVVVDIFLMLVSFHVLPLGEAEPAAARPFWGQSLGVDALFVRRALAICGAGLLAGVARFGPRHVAHHAGSVGVGVFLLSVIVWLSNMSDPAQTLSSLLVAFIAMAVAVAGSHCVGSGSRIARRLLC